MKTLLALLAASAALLFWSRRVSATSSNTAAPLDNGSAMIQGVLDMVNNGIDNITVGPRGIRNNNPGNIRLGTANWQGMRTDQTDPEFVQFISPEWGIRAINKILDSYQRRGIVTVQDIISSWAPPSENDTQAYIDAVASGMNVDPGAAVTADLRPALIAQIVLHENGIQPYDLAQIQNGVALA